mgnify:CR=1 FL=1|jgi:predicted nucleic acid-binding protein
MRFYLDTNILIYLLRAERDELCPDVLSVISNYESIMLTSTVSSSIYCYILRYYAMYGG